MSTDQKTKTSRRILRLPEVIQSTGYRRSSIYKFIQEGTFPEAKKIGPRAVGWDSIEVQNWIEERLGGEV